MVRDLRRGAFFSCAPRGAVGRDRSEATLGKLDLAGERLGFGAHFSEPTAVAATAVRVSASSASSAAEGARPSSASVRRARAPAFPPAWW